MMSDEPIYPPKLDPAEAARADQEAAEILRCSQRTIWRMIDRGELPADRVARKWLIHREDLPTARRPRPAPAGRPRPAQELSESELAALELNERLAS